MEAKHLRIGNIVSINGADVTIKSIEYNSAIDEYFVRIFEDFRQIKVSHLEPIPIIEELLLVFGFAKVDRIDFGELKPCYAIFSLAVMIRHNSFFVDWIGGNTEIKYINQLQNLYFALTGQELTIK